MTGSLFKGCHVTGRPICHLENTQLIILTGCKTLFTDVHPVCLIISHCTVE